MQHGLTQGWFQARFIDSVEYIQNHGGTGRVWVIGMYQDLLGRTSAETEVQGWLSVLVTGMASAEVAYGFAASWECQGIRIREDYWIFLGQEASEAEVNYEVDRFVEGATNEDVVAGSVGSSEYCYNPFSRPAPPRGCSRLPGFRTARLSRNSRPTRKVSRQLPSTPMADFWRPGRATRKSASGNARESLIPSC